MSEASKPATRSASTPGEATEEPLLPDVTSDERDRGWGDEPTRRDADWYRSERPPHHE